MAFFVEKKLKNSETGEFTWDIVETAFISQN
jgi:hypothetical protein